LPVPPAGVAVSRRRSRSELAPPTTIVLDAEALSVIATPGERGTSRRRASAVLTVALGAGSRVIVPAPVLAEVGRDQTRRRAVDVAIRDLPVVPTDRRVAQRAGLLLGTLGLGSDAAVDAFVAATAADNRPAAILTGDPGDLRRLVGDLPNVAVRSLDAT
jgi:predicted nucleic acid-binding protein